MRKQIKIKFVDWTNDDPQVEKTGNYSLEKNIIHEALSKHYDVTISEKPEIVFCGILGRDFIKYSCVRVLFSLEEYAPNFNVYDYAITIFDDFSFKDRVFAPVAPLINEKAKRDHDLALKKHFFSEDDLLKKTGFCSYVQSNETVGNKNREALFRLLSKYKEVDSGGKHLNTIGYRVVDKVEFESNYKFSISFLNSNSYTYQDRPTDAFAAKTIPIYMGNPDVGKIFNPRAFINCHQYRDFNDIVEVVKRIDLDDELYISMMREPAFLHPKPADRIQEDFENYLINLVENGTQQRGSYFGKIAERELYLGRKAIIRRRRLTYILVKIFKPFTKTTLGQKMRKRIMGY